MTQQWEDDWDDDDVNDDFSVQLKKELEDNAAEKKWARVYYSSRLLILNANVALQNFHVQRLFQLSYNVYQRSKILTPGAFEIRLLD